MHLIAVVAKEILRWFQSRSAIWLLEQQRSDRGYIRSALKASTLLYAIGSMVHQWMYNSSGRWSFPSSKKVPVPVISVGNIVWGGTGKTPIVQSIAKAAIERGLKPLIVSRVRTNFRHAHAETFFFPLHQR